MFSTTFRGMFPSQLILTITGIVSRRLTECIVTALNETLCKCCTRYIVMGAPTFFAFATRNPFLGTKLRGFSIGRSVGVLKW